MNSRFLKFGSQFRLVLEIEVHDRSKQVRIVGIEDYH